MKNQVFLEKFKLKNYNYTYKDQSKADKNVFFYRCSKNNCKIIIEIDKENLKKITDNLEDDKIIYKQNKSHKCDIGEFIKTEEKKLLY